MKKRFSLIALLCLFSLSFTFNAFAQDDQGGEGADADSVTEETVEEAAPEEEAVPEEASSEDEEIVEEEQSFHQVIKQKFIEGDPMFMAPVLLCLIIGLAVAIERIIALNLAETNSNKLVRGVEEELERGGVDAALELTKASRGPVASIFTQGLMRVSEGIDMVEKSVISYGSVEMSKLERGFGLDFFVYRLGPDVGFHGYGNRYDWRLRFY